MLNARWMILNVRNHADKTKPWKKAFSTTRRDWSPDSCEADSAPLKYLSLLGIRHLVSMPRCPFVRLVCLKDLLAGLLRHPFALFSHPMSVFVTLPLRGGLVLS